MKLELTDEQIESLVKAAEHFDAKLFEVVIRAAYKPCGFDESKWRTHISKLDRQ